MRNLFTLLAVTTLMGLSPALAWAQGEPAKPAQDNAKSDAAPAPSTQAPAPATETPAPATGDGGTSEPAPSDQAQRVTPPKLVSERPVVRCPSLGEGGAAKAKVSMLIRETGETDEVMIVTGIDAACDAEVLAAANALVFTPAQLGDAIVAVKIRWTVRAEGPPKPEPPPIQTGDIEGVVQELGTRTRLPGLVVRLLPSGAEVVTDAEGRFAFESVPEGEVTIVVPSYDHEELRTKLEVPLEDPKLVLRLTPLPRSRYRITVERPKSDVSRVIVSAKVASEIPGGAGDPVRVIEVMPGVGHVSGAGPGAGQIIVRGSAPEDTKYFIDGLPSPQLYHFGNIYSILQEVYIGEIDFRTGGFSTEYGNATGGILNLTLAPIPTDDVHFRADVNTYHTSVAASTPVGDEWAISGGVRRSYIDAILPAILESSGAGANLVAAPVYYDYQFRADHNPSPRSRLKLLAYGTDDGFSVEFAEPSASDPSTTGFGINQLAHMIQGSWSYIPSNDLSLRLGLVSGYQGLRLQIGEDRSFKLRVCPLVLRADADRRLSSKLRVRGGILGAIRSFGVKLELPRPVKEGQTDSPTAVREQFSVDSDGFEEQAEGWAEVRWEPTNGFGVIAGARLNKWFGDFQDFTVEPRGTVFWQASEGTRLTAGAGLNTQRPFYDETSPDIGNPNLISERSTYGVLGVKQQLGEMFAIDLQLFAKLLDDLVSPVAFDPAQPEAVPYDNAGEGTVYGGEILARLAMERFNAWLSYTLSESKRTDRPGEPERPFSYDQTHVLSFVASYALGSGWNSGLRMRYSTGNPYTPLTIGYYDSTSDVYVPRPAGPPLSDRIEDFFALDVRVSKEFRYEDWLLKVYLEINNATNQQNVENVGYRYDYSERQDINGLPLVPSFGIQGVY